MKRGALLAAKVTVSLGLLFYLFATSDLRALEERVRTADLLMLSAAVGCYVVMLGLATWRWQLLLTAANRELLRECLERIEGLAVPRNVRRIIDVDPASTL